MRICSLLPSATEIVCSLGLRDQLVAVTHECDFPPEVKQLPRVTRSSIDHKDDSSQEIHTHISEALHQGSSIYELDQQTLKDLAPDLILTQELCDVCAVSYERVQEAVGLIRGDHQIVSLEPNNLEEILRTIEQVGKVAGVPERSDELVKSLRERIDQVRSKIGAVRGRPRVFAMEWLDPPFVGGHWVPEMIRLAGGTDSLGKEGSPSFTISWQEIFESDPEIIVFMPCGFDLDRTVEETGKMDFPAGWNSVSAVRLGRVYAVDGSAYFNRPGPRIVDGLEILAEIIQPELFSRRSPQESWSKMASE